MFTGFASENTPAIQVWDFFRTFASTAAVRSVSLADDCAPIQVFRTGAATTSIRVYLPTAPIEGKQITILNQRYGLSVQSISIFSSDTSGDGTSISSPLFSLGQADSIILVYSKQNISFGTSSGILPSGWISLNKTSVSSVNYHSAIVGGDGNSASTAYCFIGGGASSTASAPYCAVIGGQANAASGSQSAIAGGLSNTASANNSSVFGGTVNIANANNGVVAGGAYGTTRSIAGNFVISASDTPVVASSGRQQLATLLLGRQTTDATATVLASNTSAAGTTNQVILPNNSAYTFQGTCIANVTGGGTTSGWKFEGVIKRGANAASTTLVAAVTPTVIAQDAGASAWVLAVTADTTNGGIAVTVTGAAATTIRWVAKIETTEVTF
ncbi:hypothetical protein UFOVP378_13 [uncultured Caudovirales phage]|uniref:Uncharacterized protein n=1 Tax=uncultured Caudovirales phage TaxID=2100421 RepID=A0A6J7X2P7_9CAUD|nr:hypothetical protein UFOVP378_13 [uncultured Caudovirales phage]